MYTQKIRPVLSDLPAGKTAILAGSALQGAIRTRLRELGMIEGTKVTCLGCGPSGDPIAYLIRGTVIALRKGDSSRIEVQAWS